MDCPCCCFVQWPSRWHRLIKMNLTCRISVRPLLAWVRSQSPKIHEKQLHSKSSDVPTGSCCTLHFPTLRQAIFHLCQTRLNLYDGILCEWVMSCLRS